jgi:hypothetical protein
MTPFPDAEDYMRAVQDPQRAFRAPSLQKAVFATHPVFGIPTPASGSAAVVFKATVNGTPQALRFFIKEDASDRRRYDELGRHFATHGLRDCVAGPTWVDEAITVNGSRWPMVQMEWVEGRTLDAYVGYLVERGEVAALHVLARAWRDQVHRLQTADFAHGDLQHGNVLVDTSASLRLVDFDGSWITDFAGWPKPNETGHENYQPVGRPWGRWMDTFPGLVIYTALLALTQRPDAWPALYSGENMLFSADDFVAPDATPTWELLGEIADPEVVQAVQRLRACCRPGWNADGSMEDLLGHERATPAARTPEPELGDFTLSGTAPPDWWERASAGTMPEPPPRSTPETAEAPVFDGAKVGGNWFDHGATVEPPAGPTPPDPTPAAVGIGIIAALVLAVMIGAFGGEPSGIVVGAVVVGLLVFFIARAALKRRR